ncbi:MAG TPA: 5-formyltetrahydrofolate cyclo-ligase, partial [Nitriliruptorales bacterium]
DPALRDHAVRRAGDRLLELPEVQAAQRVLLYASQGDELGTERVIAALMIRGAEVLLPRVAGAALEVVAIDTVDGLPAGYRGVREPVGPAVDPRDLDVAIVPGLAFDAAGGRLGRGGGHYDRLLQTLPAQTLRVGLCFAVQLVARVPHEEHDQRVDVVVTEDGCVWTSAR